MGSLFLIAPLWADNSINLSSALSSNICSYETLRELLAVSKNLPRVSCVDQVHRRISARLRSEENDCIVFVFLKKLLFIWKLRLWWFAIVSLLLKARQLSYQMATPSLMALKFAEEISKPINQICVMPLSGIIRGNLLFNVNQMTLVSTVITLDNPNVQLPPPPPPCTTKSKPNSHLHF